MEELPKEDIFGARRDLSYKDMLDDNNFSMKKR